MFVIALIGDDFGVVVLNRAEAVDVDRYSIGDVRSASIPRWRPNVTKPASTHGRHRPLDDASSTANLANREPGSTTEFAAATIVRQPLAGAARSSAT